MNWFKRLFGATYDAAERSRLVVELPYSRRIEQDEDTASQYDRATLRLKAIDQRRNNSIIAGAIQRLADNVVGLGIYPQAKTSSAQWNDAAEEFFNSWAEVADARQRLPLRDLQRLMVSSRIIQGEAFFLLTAGGQLMPVEPDRIVTPAKLKDDENIIDGVRIHRPTGIILGYYICPRDKYGVVDTQTDSWQYVQANDVIHCYQPMRFDQIRGIPDLAPVLSDLQRLHRLQQATLTKAEIEARQAWAIYRDATVGSNLGARTKTAPSSSDVGTTLRDTIEAGRIYYLKPGERAEALAPKTPSAQYESFVELSLRLIGSAIGLTYEFLLMDFSKGTYSSSRAALIQAQKVFESWHVWISRYMSRIWGWRISKAIKEGLLSPPPKDERGVTELFKVDWLTPSYEWIDPQSEATAKQLEYNMGVTTLSEIVRRKGRDIEDVLKEKGRNIADAERIAQEINKQYNTSLTWRDLITTLMPGQQPAGRNQEPTIQNKETQ